MAKLDFGIFSKFPYCPNICIPVPPKPVLTLRILVNYPFFWSWIFKLNLLTNLNCKIVNIFLLFFWPNQIQPLPTFFFFNLARESSQVPAGFLTGKFLQKQWIYEAFVVVEWGASLHCLNGWTGKTRHLICDIWLVSHDTQVKIVSKF